VKPGKRYSGAIASNAVLSLPLSPDDFTISFGYLGKNSCLILATDGLSDFIGDGSTPLGGFFQAKLPKCESLTAFLQIVDVSLYQADDDRTIIMVKGAE
jgi:serine/threonine protein phosphatase PrpC